MQARTEASPRRRGLRWVGLACVLALLSTLSLGSPAGAATSVTQLGPTGVVDKYNPTGGDQVQVKPGDSVNFKAAVAPTGLLRTLNLDSLAGTLDGALAVARFGITADFSRLPGGSNNVKLTGNTSKTYRFSRVGRYPFTWTIDKVLLGNFIPVSLDGNQLKGAGVALNAKNQYVGTVVVSNATPTLHIGAQLPSVQVHPKLPVVGSLPRITIPGVRLPSVQVPVPNLNPNRKTSTTKAGTKAGARGPDLSLFTKPHLLPVPARVMSGLGGGGGSSSGGSGGGFYSNTLPGVSPLGNGQQLTLGTTSGSSSTAKSADAAQKAADAQLAANPAPSAQLPVVLAILAIIALALVAATYARLFLLRRT